MLFCSLALIFLGPIFIGCTISFVHFFLITLFFHSKCVVYSGTFDLNALVILSKVIQLGCSCRPLLFKLVFHAVHTNPNVLFILFIAMQTRCSIICSNPNAFQDTFISFSSGTCCYFFHQVILLLRSPRPTVREK